MNKLQGSSVLKKRKEKKDEGKDIATKITTVSTRRNVTTGTSPIPIRLTENNKEDLNVWLESLSLDLNKKITAAKLFKGLIKMREQIDKEKLKEAINLAN